MRTKKDVGYYKSELREKKAQIIILNEISKTISYNWNLEQILDSIVEIASKYTESNSCFIYLVNRDGIVLKASQNPHKEILGKVIMKTGEGITGWTVKHRKTVVINSKAYQDERFKFFSTLPEDKFEAFVSVPIIFKEKIVGVINIQHIKKKKYNKDKLAFLEIIAKQVGGAIENARLILETDFLRQALETRKLVEKAKGILMKNNDLTETETQKLLNKKSMDKRKSLKEIAEAIILSDEMMK